MELRIAPVIRFVTIITALKLTVVSCVPMKYEIGYRNSIDLDAEQTEARYDQGMLSDIMNDDRVELQKAESCVADNFKYDHGQKIQRYDPCEICLCIDGEIFCWWKQCEVPTKPELSGNPAATADTTDSSSLLLTNPSSSTTTTTTTMLPSPPYPSSALGVLGSGPSSTTTTTATIPSTMTTTTTTTTSGSTLSNFLPAVLPASTDQPDDGVRILHPPSEAIPQNILSFPQTPPIMMYRPVPVASKNGTSAAIPLLTDVQWNKHRPLKKVNGVGGKKPFRKSSQKSYAITKMAAEVVPAPPITERITSGPLAVSFDEAGGRLTVGDRNDGPEEEVRKQEDEDDDDDDDDDEDDEDDEMDWSEFGMDRGSAEGQIYDGGAVRTSGGGGESGTGSTAGSKGIDEFGGYGYGMFKEPDEDKQQHYIITSSGHVEMFDDDDGGMEATEHAFGLNRLPPPSYGTTVQPPEADDVREGAIPPLITMTTNVTSQNWTTYALTPSSSFASAGGSVIDVLNSTVDGGVGTGVDYLDDNQTELIYPAVPGFSSSSSSGDGSSSRSGGRGGGRDKQPETVSVAGVTGASDTLTPSSSSAMHVDGRVTQEKHCIVMGVPYKVGAVLKQETGNCLHCVCVAGPENDPVPRVTCTPLNCPPLILPDILDGAGF